MAFGLGLRFYAVFEDGQNYSSPIPSDRECQYGFSLASLYNFRRLNGIFINRACVNLNRLLGCFACQIVPVSSRKEVLSLPCL